MAKPKKKEPMYTTKGGVRTPEPSMLGTGMAAKAGRTLKNKRKQQECTALGGKWVNGQCEFF